MHLNKKILHKQFIYCALITILLMFISPMIADNLPNKIIFNIKNYYNLFEMCIIGRCFSYHHYVATFMALCFIFSTLVIIYSITGICNSGNKFIDIPETSKGNFIKFSNKTAIKYVISLFLLLIISFFIIEFDTTGILKFSPKRFWYIVLFFLIYIPFIYFSLLLRWVFTQSKDLLV